jgi:hypothetical protein
MRLFAVLVRENLQACFLPETKLVGLIGATRAEKPLPFWTTRNLLDVGSVAVAE